MSNITVGFAMCGSFCTFDAVLPIIEQILHQGYDVIPIMSEQAYNTDTRFGTAKSFIEKLELMTGKQVIHDIKGAEPIGPKKLLDILVIAPCTGNTLGKLAGGISDSAVTLAAKAHLRNQKPVVIAVSTNDALSGSAKSIGLLLNSKNIYFVSMKQDNPQSKPRSVVAEFEMIPETIKLALNGKQIQPILL